MDVNIFKLAATKKLRFPTPVGELTVEQLYDLPLQHATSVSLDGLAIATNMALKDLSGVESFVTGKVNPAVGELELRLEIVKDVIADKIALREAAERRKSNAQKRRKLLDALDARENADMAGKSREELLKELEEIGD